MTIYFDRKQARDNHFSFVMINNHKFQFNHNLTQLGGYLPKK